jgi:hypothetical protein
MINQILTAQAETIQAAQGVRADAKKSAPAAEPNARQRRLKGWKGEAS